jgi:adenosylcobinamide-GDP ribazoletransferase
MRRALAFLTPFGRSGVPTPRTFDWFPLIGVLVGLAVGGVWWLADRAWAPLVAAAVAVGTDAVLTGGLHLDGLADTADGLLAPMDREQRLRVLRDPAIGAFGGVALATVLLLRVAALATTPARLLAVAGLWCGSRTAMAVLARRMPYARPDGGLVTAFIDPPPAGPPADSSARTDGADLEPGPPGPRAGWGPGAALSTAAGVVAALALAAAGRGPVGLGAVGAEAAAVAGVAWLAWRRIGGFTGDVLGAAGVLGETAGLLVVALR